MSDEEDRFAFFGPLRRGPGWVGGLGGQCPVQGEGRIDGHAWYFRARYSAWSLQIAEPLEALDAEDVGAGLAGWMIEDEWGERYDASWMDVDTAWGLVEAAFASFRANELPYVRGRR